MNVNWILCRAQPLSVSPRFPGEPDANAFRLISGMFISAARLQTVIVPGKPDESVLIKSVRYSDKALQMPPEQPLSAEQVAILEKWVAMGAPDPREGSAAVASVKRGIDFEAGRLLWAF